ncbi:cellulose binding domain-containing protein [Actinomadura fibrosa]|uniref:Cellulose binding domain-containing protein n=1 Tax=Actinomadura fibrosa TaxID=111802 RepID=A0ABW2Y1N9_9ACTN|nr:cellulose binding domain-containing protein [Actinomadura fibrosa]
MGRHTKHEQPDDEPAPDAHASPGQFFGAPPGPSYDAFSGPTDDQVFVSSYERPSAPPGGRQPAPPQAAERQHGPPAGSFFAAPDAGVRATRQDVPIAFGTPAHTGQETPERDARLDYGAAASDARIGQDDRTDEPESPGSGESRKNRVSRLFSLLPVPLLPIVALVVAVGIVAYALSTQQISLNFAGGAPKDPTGNAQDSQVSQRGPGQRASRGAGRPDGLVVAFRVASRTPGAFRATATITNQGGAPVTSWAIAFKIRNASVRTVTGGTVVRTGALAHVRGASTIAPGGTVRITFTATGTPARPYYCLLNRLACTLV